MLKVKPDNWRFQSPATAQPLPPSPGVTADAWGRKTYPPGRLGELMRKRDVAALTPAEGQELDRLLKEAQTPPEPPRAYGQGMQYSLPNLVPDQPGAASAPSGPMVQQRLGRGISTMAPNPEWGRANGMEWDGKQWVPVDPNRDIQRQMLEMELKRRQEDMSHEAWKRQQERTATEWALSQQMHPQNQGGVPMIQRDRDGDGIDDNGIPLYGDQPKRRRRPVADPGRAQPMLPPDQGTPYGGGDPRSLGFTPPSPGQVRLGMQEWWHNPATQQEIEVPSGWAAPQGWKRGRLGEPAGIPAEAPPAGDQRLAGVRAWNDPSNPRFSPTQLTAEKRLF